MKNKKTFWFSKSLIVLAVIGFVGTFVLGTYALFPATQETKAALNEKLDIVCEDFSQTVKMKDVQVFEGKVIIKKNLHKLVAVFDDDGKLESSKISSDWEAVIGFYGFSFIEIGLGFMMWNMIKIEKDLQNYERE